MSQWYEIWASEDFSSRALIQSNAWKHYKNILIEMGEKQLFVFRASSWKRAKARYRKWVDRHRHD